jgi:hypothetical protein
MVDDIAASLSVPSEGEIRSNEQEIRRSEITYQEITPSGDCWVSRLRESGHLPFDLDAVF